MPISQDVKQIDILDTNYHPKATAAQPLSDGAITIITSIFCNNSIHAKFSLTTLVLIIHAIVKIKNNKT